MVGTQQKKNQLNSCPHGADIPVVKAKNSQTDKWTHNFQRVINALKKNKTGYRRSGVPDVEREVVIYIASTSNHRFGAF